VTAATGYRRRKEDKNISKLRQVLIGLLALALGAGAVVLTGLFLMGQITSPTTGAAAEFANCGQGLRERGDVKLRGVLVGRIGPITRTRDGGCLVSLEMFPEDLNQIPANVGAQVRAKTIFGEKWVELLYPSEPVAARLGEGDLIPQDRTIDPIEVETILNVALPLLDAIDPEALAGLLSALSEGFGGQEQEVISSIENGIVALEPVTKHDDLVRKGIGQLAESGEVFEEIDDDLLQSMENLDELQRFTVANSALIQESLSKTPAMLNELANLFETRFTELTEIVDKGATVLGVLAARSEDLDRLLEVLPQFNSAWIRNLNHVCRHRQASDEGAPGERVPGRCWRVHNLISHSQGPYGRGESPQDRNRRQSGPNSQGVSAFYKEAAPFLASGAGGSP
jgi:phospholipid/cholesterol/gamma-HCH transport system substrate-binding protein